MELREYDAALDREASQRIWREIGWLREGQEEVMDRFIGCGRAHVGVVHDEAECLVLTAPGTLRYLSEDLPLSCVTGVTTSRVARKQAIANRLTARAVAADAAEGKLVAALYMFEQGYYNQLGFGTGSYHHRIRFDPADLQIDVKPRVPRRISEDDWQEAHSARLVRHRGHGACNILPPEMTRADMQSIKNCFGLGYRDGANGALSHYFWGAGNEAENGPYRIAWMVYHTREEFLELMGLIRNLGDQVHLMSMEEPAGIQLQDLLRKPFKTIRVTEKSRYEASIRAAAHWQMRICDLPGCLAQTHLMGDSVRFNLSLYDPIAESLDETSPWRGVGGDYVVTLGPESWTERGVDSTLPTLTASIGAFTRLWLGVRPATGLAITDTLSGPPELLEQLDHRLRLPTPYPDWDF